MEHVEDPIGVLKYISKVLKREGLMVMTFPINNISHGRNYFTKENVYDLFTNIKDLKADIKIVRLSNFASLINKLYDKIQGILVAPMKEANRFEDTVYFEMTKNPKRIFILYKFGIVLLFKISKNSHRNDDTGNRALIHAKKV
jgi:hypothetical protein